MRDEMKCLRMWNEGKWVRVEPLKDEVGRLKVKDLGFWVEGGEWRFEV